MHAECHRFTQKMRKKKLAVADEHVSGKGIPKRHGGRSSYRGSVYPDTEEATHGTNVHKLVY